MAAAGIKPAEASLRHLPTAVVELPPDQTLQVMRVIEGLEELDDVQEVYSSLHVSDAAVALLEAA